jgi:NAD(P)-dependent dehydrogenase (short-subunit alcohol dehydrogenase family)
VLALFRLVRSLARYRAAREDLQLKVLVNDVHALNEGERTLPNAGALVGLTQAIAREWSRWAVSCIDVCLDELRDEAQARCVLEAVVAEPGNAPGNLVMLRGGQRYVRRIEKLQLPRVSGTAFRERGVYLIAGGAGGIGLALSNHLASRYRARLVLVGRGAPNAEQQRAIAGIEAAGGEVLHVQADMTDLEAMRRVVARARARFGPIQGAFHSAIVLKDRTLANMDEETLLSVMAPKVQGSVALHAALAGEPLDFLVVFSSAQALLVNPGQGNYAAACTFKDAFARHLGRVAPFPVKIINWGFWGQVGIVATEAYNRRLAAQGVRPIDPKEGMEAIERILCGPLSQVMPIKLEDSALGALGIDTGAQVNVYPERMPSLLDALGEVGGWLEETRPVRTVEVRP